MNSNQMANWIARLLTVKLVNWGIRKGSQHLSKQAGKGGAAAGQGKTHREAVKRARAAARLTRRIGR